MRTAVVASQGRHAHRVASATQSCRLQRGVTQTGHWYWSSVVGWCMVRLLGGGTRNGGTGARAFDGTDVRNSVEAAGLRAGGGASGGPAFPGVESGDRGFLGGGLRLETLGNRLT